jgi:hypothetical protein
VDAGSFKITAPGCTSALAVPKFRFATVSIGSTQARSVAASLQMQFARWPADQGHRNASLCQPRRAYLTACRRAPRAGSWMRQFPGADRLSTRLIVLLVRVITIIDIALIKLIDGSVRARSKYRWPLLSSGWCVDGSPSSRSARPRRGSSPAPNPRNIAAQATAQINRGLVQRQLPGSRPKLNRVTMTVAAMATVATDGHVHRETARTPRPALV